MTQQKYKQRIQKRAVRYRRRASKVPPGRFLSPTDLYGRPDGRQKRAELKAAQELCADVMRGLRQ